MTISRVINGSGPVSSRTRSKVLEALEELGVRRDRYASIAASKRGGRGAQRLVVVDAAHEDKNGDAEFAFYSRIVMTILGRLTAAGHRTALTNLMGGVDCRLDLLVDADAVIYCSPVSAAVHRQVTAINRRMIGVSICHRQDGASMVGPDDQGGAVLAAEQAAAAGRSDVIVVTANEQESYATRTRVFIERLRSLRPGTRIEIVDYQLLSDGVHASDAAVQAVIAERWNRPGSPPGLAFAVGGYAALMLYRFAAQRRLRVPDDLAILGFDAMPFYGYLPIGIDRIEFSVPALGHLAVDDLLRRFDATGGSGPVTTLVPCTYVAGASLRPVVQPASAGTP